MSSTSTYSLPPLKKVLGLAEILAQRNQKHERNLRMMIVEMLLFPLLSSGNSGFFLTVSRKKRLGSHSRSVTTQFLQGRFRPRLLALGRQVGLTTASVS